MTDATEHTHGKEDILDFLEEKDIPESLKTAVFRRTGIG